MSKNPLNLLLRFMLELAALGAMGYWGWTQHDGIWKWISMIALPTIAAALWGIFRVPNDPGPAPVRVPGLVRLLLEGVYFSTAVILLRLAEQPGIAVGLALLLIFHYGISYDRIAWLRSQP